MSRKKVLIVACYFPPVGGAGTQRAAKFCKHLPRHGWDPIVLTTTGEQHSIWNPLDSRLAEDLPDGMRIERASFAGGVASWASRATEAAERIVREERVDAVLVTMSPFILADLALRVRERTGVRTVIDMRDPWALDGVPGYRTWFEWRRDLALMRRTLFGVDHAIANTPEAARAIGAQWPDLDERKLSVIPNGYDPDDFDDAERPARRSEGDFLLVHTGTFLTWDMRPARSVVDRVKRRVMHRPEAIIPWGRTVGPLLEAMALLRERSSPALAGLRFVHVGVLDPDTDRWIRDSPVSDLVESTGYLPHHRSIGWLLEADALFLHLHGMRGDHRARIVPGKTYEYLASGAPVLAGLPPGDARDLLGARERAFIADPCSPAEIAAQLERLRACAPERRRPPCNDEGLLEYSREALTARLASALSGSGAAGRGAPA